MLRWWQQHSIASSHHISSNPDRYFWSPFFYSSDPPFRRIHSFLIGVESTCCDSTRSLPNFREFHWIVTGNNSRLVLGKWKSLQSTHRFLCGLVFPWIPSNPLTSQTTAYRCCNIDSFLHWECPQIVLHEVAGLLEFLVFFCTELLWFLCVCMHHNFGLVENEWINCVLLRISLEEVVVEEVVLDDIVHLCLVDL